MESKRVNEAPEYRKNIQTILFRGSRARVTWVLSFRELVEFWFLITPDYDINIPTLDCSLTSGVLFLQGDGETRQLNEFGVVSQRQGTFERYMSSMITAPIVGSLAGNVLKRFRGELDHPNEKL